MNSKDKSPDRLKQVIDNREIEKGKKGKRKRKGKRKERNNKRKNAEECVHIALHREL